jgi:hypothetical protein
VLNDKLPTFNLYLCDSDDGGAGAGGAGGTGRTTSGGSGDGASSQGSGIGAGSSAKVRAGGDAGDVARVRGGPSLAVRLSECPKLPAIAASGMAIYVVRSRLNIARSNIACSSWNSGIK